MFSIKLAQEIMKRASMPFLRGVVATVAPNALGPHAGAYVSLGAIALGGALMIANVAHDRRSVPVAAARAPTATAPIQAIALDPPKAAPTAADAPTALQAQVSPVAEKSTARIDTSPIGAIPDAAKVKPKHKHHLKKIKELDKQP